MFQKLLCIAVVVTSAASIFQTLPALAGDRQGDEKKESFEVDWGGEMPSAFESIGEFLANRVRLERVSEVDKKDWCKREAHYPSRQLSLLCSSPYGEKTPPMYRLKFDDGLVFVPSREKNPPVLFIWTTVADRLYFEVKSWSWDAFHVGFSYQATTNVSIRVKDDDFLRDVSLKTIKVNGVFDGTAAEDAEMMKVFLTALFKYDMVRIEGSLFISDTPRGLEEQLAQLSPLILHIKKIEVVPLTSEVLPEVEEPTNN